MGADNICLARTQNCGIAEIDGLSLASSPLDALRKLNAAFVRGITWPYAPSEKEERKGHLFPFVIFTGVVPRHPEAVPAGMSFKFYDYGKRFADYLTEHDLGSVVSVEGPKQNWTANLIQIWVWTPNYVNVFAHIKAEAVEEVV